MAWRTYVAAVDENPVPNDSIFITIEFRDVASTPPRSFQQTYKYTSGQAIARRSERCAREARRPAGVRQRAHDRQGHDRARGHLTRWPSCSLA
jgi:hypothetical protein